MIQINGPTANGLGRLWSLALSRVAVELDRTPATTVDWNRVVAVYDGMAAKRRGSLGEVVAHLTRCVEATRAD